MNSNAVALLLFVALAVCIGDSAEIPPLPVQDDQTTGGPSSAEAQESYLGVKLYKMERPCAMLGGMCVQISECESRPGKEGLCPENGHLGVDCCYEVKPAKTLTCHEYRGACMDRCAEGLQRPSVDCTDGQKCCVLVG